MQISFRTLYSAGIILHTQQQYLRFVTRKTLRKTLSGPFGVFLITADLQGCLPGFVR